MGRLTVGGRNQHAIEQARGEEHKKDDDPGVAFAVAHFRILAGRGCRIGGGR